MQEKTAGGTPAAPIKLDVSVRVIEPVKNLMGFASVKFNDCFVVENLKIVQGSKGLFLGMPSQPDGKGGYRDMAYPVTKEFREQLNTAVLQAYEAKLEQMAERGSVGRASISDQLKAGKAAVDAAGAQQKLHQLPDGQMDACQSVSPPFFRYPTPNSSMHWAAAASTCAKSTAVR